jgi:hypothetical protein
MLKSCCPVFVLLVAIAFRLERASLPLAAAVVLIAGGTATTAATGVGAISALGLLIQFSSEMCEAFRLCLAQVSRPPPWPYVHAYAPTAVSCAARRAVQCCAAMRAAPSYAHPLMCAAQRAAPCWLAAARAKPQSRVLCCHDSD